MNPSKSSDRYRITAFNIAGQDPSVVRWWLGNEFNCLLLQAQQAGHALHLWLWIIIDELLSLCSKELLQNPTASLPPVRRLYTLGRFAGQGVAGGTQNLTSLDSTVANNSAVIFVKQCPDYDEACAAAKLISWPRERIPVIQKLKKNEAIVFCAGWEQPIKVTIPFLDFGDYPSAETVRARLAPELEWIRQHNVYAEYPDPTTPPIEFMKIVGEPKAPPGDAKAPPPEIMEDNYRLLREFHDNPLDGLSIHYSRLGIGVERGNRLLGELKQLGAVTIQEEKSAKAGGGRGRKIATVTPQGRLILEAFERKRKSK